MSKILNLIRKENFYFLVCLQPSLKSSVLFLFTLIMLLKFQRPFYYLFCGVLFGSSLFAKTRLSE